MGQDTEAIERVVQLYIDGAKAGDASKLREGFDDRGWMFGELGGQRYDMPLPEYIAMADGHAADVDGSYKARIVSIEQVGDAATAVVEEEGFWGTVSFTDFFTLSRIDGSWKIVNKTFVHTGGEPPAFD
jgi:hypothetical protein